MRTTYSVKVLVTVYDEAALIEAAVARALQETPEFTRAEALETLGVDESEDGRPTIEACLQMLFDPGVSPDGCTIEESNAEYLYSDREDGDEDGDEASDDDDGDPLGLCT